VSIPNGPSNTLLGAYLRDAIIPLSLRGQPTVMLYRAASAPVGNSIGIFELLFHDELTLNYVRQTFRKA